MKKKYTILLIVLLLSIIGWLLWNPSSQIDENKININITENKLSSSNIKGTNLSSSIVPSSVPKNYNKLDKNILSLVESTLKALLYCNKSNNCPIAKNNFNDPKSDIFLRQKLINDELEKVIKLVQNGDIRQEPMEKLAIDVITDEYATGGTQAKAISLLPYLEPTSNIKDALLNMLSDTYYDSITASTALVELRRYPDDNEITNRLTSIISRGSSSLKESVSKSILPFINDNNLEAYKETLKQIPHNSVVEFNLESNIQEYETRNTNG